MNAVLADPGTLFELKPTFAGNMVTGFARLGGRPVGFLANQPLQHLLVQLTQIERHGERFTRGIGGLPSGLEVVAHHPLR